MIQIQYIKARSIGRFINIIPLHLSKVYGLGLEMEYMEGLPRQVWGYRAVSVSGELTRVLITLCIQRKYPVGLVTRLLTLRWRIGIEPPSFLQPVIVLADVQVLVSWKRLTHQGRIIHTYTELLSFISVKDTCCVSLINEHLKNRESIFICSNGAISRTFT